MKRTLKYKANWLSRMTFILFGLFFLHSNLGAFLSQIEIGNNVGVFEYSLELEDGFALYEQNFDPWGRNRNPNTWKYENIPVTYAYWKSSNRGFTGHEHLPNFKLINMNGRMYDPVVGRMLSTDNNIIGGYTTQGYDRYSYALNNPLKYTDPDGEHPILIAMLISAAVHTGAHLFKNGSFDNWNWGAFVGSVVAGGVAGGIAPALSGAQIGGFYAGAITGGSAGATQTLVSGIWNKDLSLKGFAEGVLIGAAIGGLIGGVDASIKGNRFLDGKSKSPIERYIQSSGDSFVKDGDYASYEIDGYTNETREFLGSKKIPKTRTIKVTKGYEGDLTIDVDLYPQPGQEYFFKADGKDVFSTIKRGKFSFLAPGNSKVIEFGIRGNFASTFQDIGNGTFSSLHAYPTSWTKIYGTWRSFGGFLWFP